MGACCTPNCPTDGSRGGMSDGCGKTCACPSGDVVYQRQPAASPIAPPTAATAAMPDSCGSTCACAKGSALYMGACCTPNCPTDGSRGDMSDGCGKTCACPSGDVIYQRCLLHAQLPRRRQQRRQVGRLRRDLCLCRPGVALHAALLHAELSD